MTEELNLNLSNEVTDQKSPQNMSDINDGAGQVNSQIPQIDKKQPNQEKKSHKVRWIIISIFVLLVLVISISFYGLIKENIDLLLNKNSSSNVNDIATNDDPYVGSPDAKIVIVEFSDFQCPYCAQAFSIVHEIINIYGDQIKFIYRDFPNNTLHPQAQKAAEAGECAAEQDKFWEMHDKIFTSTDLSVVALKQYADELGLETVQFNECLDSDRYLTEIQQDFASGIVAGVDGTPTFFINGTKFEGVVSVDNFKSIIDNLLVIYNNN